MKIYTLAHAGRNYEYWYDRQYRVWYAAEIDAEGNLGESVNAYTKGWVVDYIKRGFVPEIKKNSYGGDE